MISWQAILKYTGIIAYRLSVLYFLMAIALNTKSTANLLYALAFGGQP